MKEKDPRAEAIELGLARNGRSVRWMAQKVKMSAPGLGYLLREGAKPQRAGLYEEMMAIVRDLDGESARIAEAAAQLAVAGSTRLPRMTAGTSTKVKVYGAVSAGDGNTSAYDERMVDVPVEFAREDYGALVIEGDSMMPFLQPSDVAIFKDHRAEKVNHIVAAQLEAGGWVCKFMVYEEGRFLLRSLNPKYADLSEGFQIVGFLVGFIRDDGPERLIRLNPYGLRP